MTRIETTITIAAPIEVVFDLARSVEAHQASTAWSGERAVAGKTSGLLGPGEAVTWRARHLGVVQELTGVITEFDPPRHFQDRMLRGPFKSLRHDHYFEPTADGGCLMRDVLEFEAPLGPLGRLAEALFLEAYMRRFLERRAMALKKLAERPL
jgi:ligand-binding SRPBCC domain-containing protein